MDAASVNSSRDADNPYGEKTMDTKNNPGDFDCYTNAEPDEPTILALVKRLREDGDVYVVARGNKQVAPDGGDAFFFVASQKAKEVEEPAAMVRRGLMIITPSDHGDIALHTAVMLPDGPLPPQIMFEGKVFKPDPSRGATYVIDTSVIETSPR